MRIDAGNWLSVASDGTELHTDRLLTVGEADFVLRAIQLAGLTPDTTTSVEWQHGEAGPVIVRSVWAPTGQEVVTRIRPTFRRTP